MKSIYNYNNVVLNEITTIDSSNKSEKHKSFKKISGSEFVCDGITININLDNNHLAIFTISKKLKKIILSFCIKNNNSIFHVHTEAISDIFKAGIDEKGTIAKSMFFLGIKNADEEIHFANSLPCKFLSYFNYKKDENFVYVDFITEFPDSFDGEFKSEELLISTKVFSKALNDFINEKEHTFENVIGWSSWDYYFTDINEKCIKENVDFISNDLALSQKIKYILIDDGWEHYEGYWKEGPNFPSGLKSIATYIKNKGFKPGIWTCPIRFNVLCPTIMRRNDFLIKNEFGDPVIVDGCYVLDPTHPDGEKFIKETYKYLYSCGFVFYKIDFICYLIEVSKFYDTKAGPYDAIRKLLTIIRECVGKSSHIMGCNLPYGTGYGYVDSRRVGLDIHNNFGHLIKCTEYYLPQYASHKKIYQNDLDYLVIRGNETSKNDKYNVLNPTTEYWKCHETNEFVWRKGDDFSYNEAKMWCAILLLSGSTLFLGDRLSKLNKRGLILIYTAFKYADFVSAKPVDYFTNPIPTIWKKDGVIAVLNPFNEKKIFVLDKENDTFIDIFTQTNYKPNDAQIVVELAPHDCVYLIKKEV